ncbi:hypothetical protein PVAND_004527 [Polypedilum vanderplanki]|uniref:Mitochondrial fission 1 protein n=1 Tax=Polypedilum vanderplanki TaxID=319348 RepID=A0A9J6BYE8_POLVA|nr:hypothetical protein PVAND_004527 [Polypedilum vanderplanki]
MEEMLNVTVTAQELEKYEKIYMRELSENKKASNKTQFDFASCLVRSKYGADIHNGIKMFENLSKEDPENKRDYIYFIAIAYTRLKDWQTAHKYVKTFLEIEPNNLQVSYLNEHIEKEMNKELKKEVALAGSVILGIGAVAGLAFALAKK